MKSRVRRAKKSLKSILLDIYKVLRRPDMVILPGTLAFYFVLALIPTISLLSYGASILNLSVDFIYDFLAHSFSSDIANMVLGVKLNSASGFGFVVTIIVGLYIASNGADAMILSSNTIYGIKNKPWYKRRIKALFMTLTIILLLMFLLIVPVFGDIITKLLTEVNLNKHITDQILFIYDIIKGPITWIIIFILVRVLYSIAPDKDSDDMIVNYGAIFTTVMFVVGTKVYSIYVTHYAHYTALYGSLANIVILMFWFYYLSYIFTIGLALNYQKEDKINLQ